VTVETLGDAVELSYGKSLPVRARRRGSIPVYGSNGAVGFHDEALVREPTVIVGRKGSVGAIHLVSGPSFPIDTTYFVRARPGISIDIRYAAYALKHMDLSRLRTETGVPGLNREDAYREPFLLPPLAEQQGIVDILDRAARIEALRTRVAEGLRMFAPALFIKMFGDPTSNPMDWPRRRMGDLCNVQGGLQVTRKRSVHPLEAPYLRVANVLRDRLVLDNIKRIRLTEAELTRTRLLQGDLLIVEGHGNAAEIGRVAVWDGHIKNCVHQNHLIRARPDHTLLAPEFAAAYLNSSSGRRQLLQRGKTTSGLNTITTSDVKDCSILVPPVGLQAMFSAIVARTRDTLRRTEVSAQVSSDVSASLMRRLLSAPPAARTERVAAGSLHAQESIRGA